MKTEILKTELEKLEIELRTANICIDRAVTLPIRSIYLQQKNTLQNACDTLGEAIDLIESANRHRSNAITATEKYVIRQVSILNNDPREIVKEIKL